MLICRVLRKKCELRITVQHFVNLVSHDVFSPEPSPRRVLFFSNRWHCILQVTTTSSCGLRSFNRNWSALMLHSSSKISSANMARSPVGSCLCLLAWTLARGFAQKLLGPSWQSADKGVFGLLFGGKVFPVLVADYDKTLPEIVFFLKKFFAFTQARCGHRQFES